MILFLILFNNLCFKTKRKLYDKLFYENIFTNKNHFTYAGFTDFLILENYLI